MSEEQPSAVSATATAGRFDPIKQFDYAKDAIAQVITLSSAILAVSLTFSQNWAVRATPGEKRILQTSWAAFLLAIIVGVWAMLAIAGVAFRGGGDLRGWSVRLPWMLEVLAFLAGLGLLTWFGYRVL